MSFVSPKICGLKDVLLALLSGLLLVPCFPALDLWWLAWVALVPLLIALKGKSLRVSFGLSFLTGITFLMGIFGWITNVTGFTLTDFGLAAVYMACYYGLFGVLLTVLSQKSKIPFMIAASIAWVSIEYLRSHFFALNLPLGLLGHSQYQNLPVLQVASVTGVYGISFLIVLLNGSLAEIIEAKGTTLRPLLVPVILLAAVIGYGLYALSIPSAPESVKVTVVQGNLPKQLRPTRDFRRTNFETHVRLTKEALAEKPSLIVWPEVAAQGSLARDEYLRAAISTLAKESGSFMVIGSAERPKYGDKEFKRAGYFNSAFIVSPGGIITGQYDKVILFPFSEYVPYKGIIPWPARYYSKMASFSPGIEQTIFDLGNAKFAVTICWENMVPEFFRLFVKNGANFIVNITNESIFGEGAAPYMFLAIAAFRAAENRVAIARSAYTGISAFIDPSGRIIQRLEKNGKHVFIEGQLTGTIPVSRTKTFYTIYGDIFAYVNLAVCVLALLMILMPWHSIGKTRVRSQLPQISPPESPP